MVSVNQPTDQKWGNLNCDRGNLTDFEKACLFCGGAHLTQSHMDFIQTMPQDPVDMVDDLMKMGLYKQQQIQAADRVDAYELRKTL